MFPWKIFQLFSLIFLSRSCSMLFVMCLMNFLSCALRHPEKQPHRLSLCSRYPFSALNRAREKRCWNNISRLFVDVVKVESVPFHHNGEWFEGGKEGNDCGSFVFTSFHSGRETNRLSHSKAQGVQWNFHLESSNNNCHGNVFPLHKMCFSRLVKISKRTRSHRRRKKLLTLLKSFELFLFFLRCWQFPWFLLIIALSVATGFYHFLRN